MDHDTLLQRPEVVDALVVDSKALLAGLERRGFQSIDPTVFEETTKLLLRSLSAGTNRATSLTFDRFASIFRTTVSSEHIDRLLGRQRDKPMVESTAELRAAVSRVPTLAAAEGVSSVPPPPPPPPRVPVEVRLEVDEVVFGPLRITVRLLVHAEPGPAHPAPPPPLVVPSTPANTPASAAPSALASITAMPPATAPSPLLPPAPASTPVHASVAPADPVTLLLLPPLAADAAAVPAAGQPSVAAAALQPEAAKAPEPAQAVAVAARTPVPSPAAQVPLLAANMVADSASKAAEVPIAATDPLEAPVTAAIKPQEVPVAAIEPAVVSTEPKEADHVRRSATTVVEKPMPEQTPAPVPTSEAEVGPAPSTQQAEAAAHVPDVTATQPSSAPEAAPAQPAAPDAGSAPASVSTLGGPPSAAHQTVPIASAAPSTQPAVGVSPAAAEDRGAHVPAQMLVAPSAMVATATLASSATAPPSSSAMQEGLTATSQTSESHVAAPSPAVPGELSAARVAAAADNSHAGGPASSAPELDTSSARPEPVVAQAVPATIAVPGAETKDQEPLPEVQARLEALPPSTSDHLTANPPAETSAAAATAAPVEASAPAATAAPAEASAPAPTATPAEACAPAPTATPAEACAAAAVVKSTEAGSATARSAEASAAAGSSDASASVPSTSTAASTSVVVPPPVLPSSKSADEDDEIEEYLSDFEEDAPLPIFSDDMRKPAAASADPGYPQLIGLLERDNLRILGERSWCTSTCRPRADRLASLATNRPADVKSDGNCYFSVLSELLAARDQTMATLMNIKGQESHDTMREMLCGHVLSRDVSGGPT